MEERAAICGRLVCYRALVSRPYAVMPCPLFSLPAVELLRKERQNLGGAHAAQVVVELQLPNHGDQPSQSSRPVVARCAALRPPESASAAAR